MELLFCLGLSALIVVGYYFLKDAFKWHHKVQESAEAFRMQLADRKRAEANSPRILVRLSTGNTVAGWAPCQRVTIPDGEYVAWATTRPTIDGKGEEESVCFAQVEQTWNGENMRRDVYVRVADYPYLQNFPTESSHLQVLSANVEKHPAKA